MMDSRQFRYLLEIEKQHSISRAAEKLYLTQSALNQQLLKVERELGVCLFERKGRQMVPTPAGVLYLKSAKELLSHYEETCAQIRSVSEIPSGELKIALTPEYGVRMFSAIYPEFHRIYPRVTFKIREERTRAIERLVLDREVSIAFSTTNNTSRDSRLQYFVFYEESVYLAVPKMLVTSSAPEMDNCRAVMNLLSIYGIPMALPSWNTQLRQQIEIVLQYYQIKPNILVECSNVSALVSMLSSQICAAFLPGSYIREGLQAYCFPVDPPQIIKRCAVSLADHVISPIENKLIELAGAYRE